MVQSYKIFVKDSPIYIGEAQFNDHRGDMTRVSQGELLNDLIPFLTRSYQEKPRTFQLQADPASPILDILKQRLTLIVAAGGLVWNTKGQLLMIYRRGKWDLPKGKVEEGESLETAALREVEEESGVGKLRLLSKFTNTYHIYPEGQKWILKESCWYEMLSQDNGAMHPQLAEGITEAAWVPKNEIPLKIANTYASMKDLVEQVLQYGYGADQPI